MCQPPFFWYKSFHRMSNLLQGFVPIQTQELEWGSTLILGLAHVLFFHWHDLAAPSQSGSHRFAFPSPFSLRRVKPSRARLTDVVEKRMGVKSGLFIGTPKQENHFSLWGIVEFCAQGQYNVEAGHRLTQTAGIKLLFKILEHVVAFCFLFIWKPAEDKKYHHNNKTGEGDEF